MDVRVGGAKSEGSGKGLAVLCPGGSPTDSFEPPPHQWHTPFLVPARPGDQRFNVSHSSAPCRIRLHVSRLDSRAPIAVEIYFIIYCVTFGYIITTVLFAFFVFHFRNQ